MLVVHASGMPGTFFPPPRVSDPDMHHGTCVMHVPWCMPGSLTSGFLWIRYGENVLAIPDKCATRNFAYLLRGPWPPLARHLTSKLASYGLIPITHVVFGSVLFWCPFRSSLSISNFLFQCQDFVLSVWLFLPWRGSQDSLLATLHSIVAMKQKLLGRCQDHNRLVGKILLRTLMPD